MPPIQKIFRQKFLAEFKLAFDRVYAGRLKHRESCKDWLNGHCDFCGYGLNRFRRDVLAELEK